MSFPNAIVTLHWQSRLGMHHDRHALTGVVPDTDTLAARLAIAVLRTRNPAEICTAALQGWKHTPPCRGRFYPRGLLHEFARTDLRPFRVLVPGATEITADFNPPLAGIAPRVDITPLDPTDQGNQDQTAEAFRTLAAWLDNGPGMQAPLPDVDTDFLAGTPFARNDESPDAHFYARERLVNHLDDVTRADITAHYRRVLQPDMRVLDLMASWNSHLPEKLPLHVTGLGMNENELGHNPRLNERSLHDLNQNPMLPFAAEQFDAALCALSIEYLIDPLAVLQQIGRVLKPGAPCVISFSDRWFPPKAIRLWSELHPFERLGFVAQLMRLSGVFTQIETDSLQGRPAPCGDWRPQRRPFADPLFIVTGRRCA